MKYYLLILLTIISGLIVQSIWCEYFAPYGLMPHIIIIIVIYFSLREGKLFGEIVGFISGFFLDLLNEGPFGLQALLLTIIGYLSGTLSGIVNENKINVQILVTFAMSLLFILFQWLLLRRFVNITIFFQPLISALLAPLIFKLLDIWSCKIILWTQK